MQYWRNYITEVLIVSSWRPRPSQMPNLGWGGSLVMLVCGLFPPFFLVFLLIYGIWSLVNGMYYTSAIEYQYHEHQEEDRQHQISEIQEYSDSTEDIWKNELRKCVVSENPTETGGFLLTNIGYIEDIHSKGYRQRFEGFGKRQYTPADVQRILKLSDVLAQFEWYYWVERNGY